MITWPWTKPDSRSQSPEWIRARALALRDLKNSPAWIYLEKELKDRMQGGWEDFIYLPAEEKTTEKAYSYQARFACYKDLIEWIDHAIQEGIDGTR